MKKTLFKFSIIFGVFIFATNGYSQDILWEKSYGGKHAEYLMDIQPTADYGFILAGSSLSNKTGNKDDENKGDFDYWIWKMDEKGELDWQKSFGGSGTDFLQSIKNTRDGGFILAGISNSPNGNDKKDPSRGGDDFWILKLDATGGIEWQQTIGGKGQEKLKNICLTSDGGYIIGGSSSSSKSDEKADDSYGNMDYWVVKLDNKGAIQWQKTFGGRYFDELRSIEQTKDFGYILGGYSNSPESGNKEDKSIGYGDYWILKLDQKGAIEWQKTIGGVLDEQLSVIHQTYDGNYLIGGSTNSNATKSKTQGDKNGNDIWIVKVDNEGDILWEEKYNIGDFDILSSLVENKDHTILLGGFAQSEVKSYEKKDASGINDYTAIKINEKGEELWRKTVGSSGEDVLKKVIETRDGGYVMAGTSNPAKSNNKPIIVSRNSNAKKDSQSKSGLGGINNNFQDASSSISDSAKETNKKAADLYSETVGDAKNKLTDALGIDKNSSLANAISMQNNPLESILPSSSGNSGSSSGSANGSNSPSNQNQKIPSSRNKSTNYGSSDFWVVKLKDTDKPKVVKATIEAFPNPTTTYTNVIVGYDYIGGTATLVDMAGRVLQQFTIKDRTIPVNLKSLPEGVYIINIKTDKQSDGVKIIKKANVN